MLLVIWLVLYHQTPSLNPCRLDTLVYTNRFTSDVIHEYAEASLGFPCEVSLEKKRGDITHAYINAIPQLLDQTSIVYFNSDMRISCMFFLKNLNF